jgi:haloalkane dehalogenase
LLCAFGDCDPLTRGADGVLRDDIPGAAGQPHTTIEGGGHFIQEDRGPQLARIVVDFMGGA